MASSLSSNSHSPTLIHRLHAIDMPKIFPGLPDRSDHDWRLKEAECRHCMNRPVFREALDFCSINCSVLWHEQRGLPPPLCEGCGDPSLERHGTECLSCNEVKEERKARVTAEEAEAHFDPCPAGTRRSASALSNLETPKRKKMLRLPPPSNEIILRSSPEQKEGRNVGLICDPASPSPLARLASTSPAHHMYLASLSVTPSLDPAESTASVDARSDRLLEGLKQHQTDLSTSLFDTRGALIASRSALAASESARKETEEKLAAVITERDQAVMDRNQAVAERHRAVAERLQAIANEEMKRAKGTMEELAKMQKGKRVGGYR